MSDLTLYELSTKNDDAESCVFSPFVWMTRVDLAILGLEPKLVKMSFTQIRNDLAALTSDKEITVPTIKSGDDYLSESWDLAEWLDKNYGKGEKTLFPGGQESKGLHKFILNWANTTIGPAVGPFAKARVYESLDEPCREYWLESRFGGDPSKIPPFLKSASDRANIESKTAEARQKFRLLESLLKYQQSIGNPLVLTGKTHSHADAAVFGWYAFSRMHKDLVEGIWEHKDLPLLKQWVEGMKELVGEKELPDLKRATKSAL